jgi:hypothetical protein
MADMSRRLAEKTPIAIASPNDIEVSTMAARVRHAAVEDLASEAYFLASRASSGVDRRVSLVPNRGSARF